MTQPPSNPGPWTRESAFPVGLKEREGWPHGRTGPRRRPFLSPARPGTHRFGDRRRKVLGQPWPVSGLGAGRTPHAGLDAGTAPRGHRLARGAPSQSTAAAKGPAVLGQPCGRRGGPRPSVPCLLTPAGQSRGPRELTGCGALRRAPNSKCGLHSAEHRQAHPISPAGARRARVTAHRAGLALGVHTACMDPSAGHIAIAAVGRTELQQRAGGPARGRKEPGAGRAAGAPWDPEPVPPWAPWAGPTALP